MQDGSEASEGLALASAALDSARPLVREAEQAQQKLDTSRHEAENVRRYASFTADPLHKFIFCLFVCVAKP